MSRCGKVKVDNKYKRRANTASITNHNLLMCRDENCFSQFNSEGTETHHIMTLSNITDPSVSTKQRKS